MTDALAVTGVHATVHCSFCGKRDDEVKKMIHGPTVHICNECIEVCIGSLLADDISLEICCTGNHKGRVT